MIYFTRQVHPLHFTFPLFFISLLSVSILFFVIHTFHTSLAEQEPQQHTTLCYIPHITCASDKSVFHLFLLRSVCTSIWPLWNPTTAMRLWSSALNSAWLFEWSHRPGMKLFAGKHSNKASLTFKSAEAKMLICFVFNKINSARGSAMLLFQDKIKRGGIRWLHQQSERLFTGLGE